MRFSASVSVLLLAAAMAIPVSGEESRPGDLAGDLSRFEGHEIQFTDTVAYVWARRHGDTHVRFDTLDVRCRIQIAKEKAAASDLLMAIYDSPVGTHKVRITGRPVRVDGAGWVVEVERVERPVLRPVREGGA